MGMAIPKQPSRVLFKLLQPKVLNGILILLVFSSIFYLLFLIVQQRAVYNQDVLELTGLKKFLTPSTPMAVIEEPMAPQKSDYQTLAGAPFFREPNFVAEKKPQQEAVVTTVDLSPYRALKVMGLVGGNQAIIQDPATKTTLYVKQGDLVKEGVVTSVQPGKVTIKVGEETVELNF